MGIPLPLQAPQIVLWILALQSIITMWPQTKSFYLENAKFDTSSLLSCQIHTFRYVWGENISKSCNTILCLVSKSENYFALSCWLRAILPSLSDHDEKEENIYWDQCVSLDLEPQTAGQDLGTASQFAPTLAMFTWRKSQEKHVERHNYKKKQMTLKASYATSHKSSEKSWKWIILSPLCIWGNWGPLSVM